MRKLFIGLILLTSYSVSGQVINKIPQYGFKNQLSVGRDSDNDTIAYFQVGPNSGGNRGIILPRVANTSSLIGTPKRGLVVYDDSKDSLGYYNGAQWIYLGGGGDTAIAEQGSTHIETTGYYLVADSINTIICQYSGGETGIDLPDPSAHNKREITISNVSGNDASFNYLLKYSASEFSATLANGKWVKIKSDGSWWNVVQDSGGSTVVSGGGGNAVEGEIF